MIHPFRLETVLRWLPDASDSDEAREPTNQECMKKTYFFILR